MTQTSTGTSPAAIQIGRNYGIDLLRILSMFMVVLLHVGGVGGLNQAAAGQPFKQCLLSLLNIAAVCAVNCYGLISGYVGYKSTFRLSNLATLWLQVFFYSAGFAILFFLLSPQTTSLKEVAKLFMPVIMERYWYFTAYFMLFLVSPLLNVAITYTPQKLFGFVLLISLFFLTVCQSTVLCTNAFGTNSGYSFVWLAVLYCVGGYIGKYGACVLIVCGAEQIFSHYKEAIHNRLAAYNSPFVLLMAVGLLTAFAGLQLPKWMTKGVGWLAPLSFGVYLIHLHPFVRNNLLMDAFAELVRYPAVTMIPLGLGLTAAIYLVCSAIDLVRHHLFRWLKLKERLRKLEEKHLLKWIQ